MSQAADHPVPLAGIREALERAIDYIHPPSFFGRKREEAQADEDFCRAALLLLGKAEVWWGRDGENDYREGDRWILRRVYAGDTAPNMGDLVLVIPFPEEGERRGRSCDRPTIAIRSSAASRSREAHRPT